MPGYADDNRTDGRDDGTSPAPQPKFVWPPRPPRQSHPEPSESSVPSEPAALSNVAAASPVYPPRRAQTPGVVRVAIREMERVWLGVTREPFALQAGDAGWLADDAESYCPTCGSAVGEFELIESPSGPARCADCARTRPSWDRFIRLAAYEGIVREAIHDLKFRALRAAGWELGAMLGDEIGRVLAAQQRDPDKVIIVPVPVHPWRRLRRGIDHTATLARAVRASLRRNRGYGVRARVVTALSRRLRRPQAELSLSERRTNVAGSFRLRRVMWPIGRRRVENVDESWTIVVLDDVRTTGATMREATKVLRAALRDRDATGNRAEGAGRPTRRPMPAIWAAVVAVTPDPTRRQGGNKEEKSIASGSVSAGGEG